MSVSNLCVLKLKVKNEVDLGKYEVLLLVVYVLVYLLFLTSSFPTVFANQ